MQRKEHSDEGDPLRSSRNSSTGIWSTGEFLQPEDSRWTEALQGFDHDVYHLPEYVRLVAEEEGAEGLAYWSRSARGEAFIPLVLKSLPERCIDGRDRFDASSPYGYSAPLLKGDEDSIRLLLERFRESASLRGLVSVFLRSHPLLDFPSSGLSAIGTVVLHGETVYVDLEASETEIWSNTRSRDRSYIRRLQDQGFVFSMDTWEHYEAFKRIYAETMERRNAESGYLFSDHYFEAVRSRLAEYLHLGVVVGPNGEVASAALFFRYKGFLQYHLGGTAEGFVQMAPSKLLMSSARFWAKNRGCTTLHLGGGYRARRDSLLRFKSGFSKLRADFQTARIVCNAHVYQTLTAEILGEEQQAADGIFPAYRARGRSDRAELRCATGME